MYVTFSYKFIGQMNLKSEKWKDQITKTENTKKQPCKMFFATVAANRPSKWSFASTTMG